MEFLESLRRLEEDVENYEDFEQLPVHSALEQRFRNTLYLGKAAEGISLPVADVAVDLFQNAAEKKLGTFTRRHVAKFNRNGQINPSSSVLGMMYARRLKRQKSDFLKKVTSTELFLVSMMLATKFLYDEGEEEEIFSDEWAESAKMDVKRVNELEREFLDAIDWDLYIKPDEFYEFLQQMETWIALSEGQRRGWFSYSDFNVLMDHRDWHATMASLLEQAAKVLGICMAVYSLCGATLCWSLLVAQHHSTIPGIPLASANRSHVFHGLLPLKATQVASHQSEILLPPVDANPVDVDSDPVRECRSVPDAKSTPPCPSCRRSCCTNAPGSSATTSNTIDCHSLACSDSLDSCSPASCESTTCTSQEEEFWLRQQIARARQATVTFYQALVLAYYDAAMEMKLETPLDNGNPDGPTMRSRDRSINLTARPGDHNNNDQTLSVPSDLNCPRWKSLSERASDFGDSTAAKPNSESNTRPQCSVCDGAQRKGVVRETVHMLLPSYADIAVGLTTGTIPVIVA